MGQASISEWVPPRQTPRKGHGFCSFIWEAIPGSTVRDYKECCRKGSKANKGSTHAWVPLCTTGLSPTGDFWGTAWRHLRTALLVAGEAAF